jgi:hypothetical protein
MINLFKSLLGPADEDTRVNLEANPGIRDFPIRRTIIFIQKANIGEKETLEFQNRLRQSQRQFSNVTHHNEMYNISGYKQETSSNILDKMLEHKSDNEALVIDLDEVRTFGYPKMSEREKQELQSLFGDLLKRSEVYDMNYRAKYRSVPFADVYVLSRHDIINMLHR